MDNGRKLALLELQKMPKGTFYAEDILDTNSNNVEDIPIKVKVTITDDTFELDYTGTGDAVFAPINCSYYGALSGARISVRLWFHHILPLTTGFTVRSRSSLPKTVFSMRRNHIRCPVIGSRFRF